MPLDNKEISAIIEAHGLYNGDAAEAARHLPYSGPTIIKYWRANGLPIGECGLRADGKYGWSPTDEEISEITRSHGSCDGNAAEAARHLQYSSVTIRRYWKENNLPIGKHGGRRKRLESEVLV